MPNLKSKLPQANKKVELLPYGFKAKAERISEHYRKHLNINPSEPLLADILTSFLDIHVKELNLVENISSLTVSDILDGFGSAFSAVTLFCPANNRFMIVHNHSHSQERKESNLMHECAHIILEHSMEEFDNSNGFNLRNYNKVQEAEAKYLGHCLQLPAKALTKYYIYNGHTKESISEKFMASLEVVNYRIRVCGTEKIKQRLRL